MVDDGKHHILFTATGSVATIKLPLIAHDLIKHPNVSVGIVVTLLPLNFCSRKRLSSLLSRLYTTFLA